MKIIALCVDKDNGRLFCGQRTSCDKEVRRRLLDMCEKLYLDSYSARQFSEDNCKEKLVIVDSPASVSDGFVFIEKEDIPDDADQIIVFNWNRKYPADKWLDFSFSGWHKTKKEDFEGYSHPKVTMHIWKREKQ